MTREQLDALKAGCAANKFGALKVRYQTEKNYEGIGEIGDSDNYQHIVTTYRDDEHKLLPYLMALLTAAPELLELAERSMGEPVSAPTLEPVRWGNPSQFARNQFPPGTMFVGFDGELPDEPAIQAGEAVYVSTRRGDDALVSRAVQESLRAVAGAMFEHAETRSQERVLNGCDFLLRIQDLGDIGQLLHIATNPQVPAGGGEDG